MKVGDRVICRMKPYPASEWGEGTITSVQSTGDGFDIIFENGKKGFLFSSELALVHECDSQFTNPELEG